jgi:hypothetical protein
MMGEERYENVQVLEHSDKRKETLYDPQGFWLHNWDGTGVCLFLHRGFEKSG